MRASLFTASLTSLTVALAAACAMPPAEAGPSTARRTATLVQALRKQEIASVRFEDVTLNGAIKWLRIATGHNYVLKQRVLIKEGLDVEAIRYSIRLERVKVATFLHLLLEPHGLAAVVKGNVVFITSKADSYGKPITRMYGIAHITYQKTDFPGPSLNLTPSDFVGEEYLPEVPVEDDPLTEGEGVIELLQQMVTPAAWAEQDTWSMSATRRYVIVRAPASVHRLIPRALQQIQSLK